jgi:hypothetical protein
MDARPVDAGAANAGPRLERTDLAVGRRAIVLAMADRDGGLRQVLKQAVPGRLGNLVNHLGVGPVRHGGGVVPTFQSEHAEPCLRQFDRHDCAGPAEADDDDVDGLVDRRHQPRAP